ncbi:hypothetical protein MRB53_008084 [Persea americana]|uniref:Uncharacterized protein n=1 Tax=Persea americana TaxID=3435 RepID=A0ACC2ML29_PERAE|nr:hypothetical protein MRB53_008084 [Persea americana]
MASANSAVVEDVSGWLRVFDDGTVDRSWTGPKEVEFLTSPAPPSDGEFLDGVATRDIVIDPESNLSVRIYLPEKLPGDDPKLPIILHFHGGGFCITRANCYMYYLFYTRLVKSARAICISVEMRLAPEHRLPAAIDDCYAALLWLRDLARAELTEPWLGPNADFSRVFMVGDSTGGTTVHNVSARAGSEEWSPLRLAGGVLLHPGFHRSELSRSEMEAQFETPFLTLDMINRFMALALPLGSTKDHPIICPMGPAAPPLADLRLPPFLVVVAERDLLHDRELEYVDEMKKAGKDVELMVNRGVGHCFYLNKVAIDSDPVTAAQTELLIESISDFIRNH